MFKTEVVINGEYAKGKIHQSGRNGEAQMCYLETMHLSKGMSADDIRVFANELFNVADKVDTLNGVTVRTRELDV